MSGTRFQLSARTNQQTGEPFRLRVEALDLRCEPDRNYCGRVSFTATDPEAVLPADHTFEPAEAGCHWAQVTLQTGGVHTVRVQQAGAEGSGESPPLVVQATVPEKRLFWGDLCGRWAPEVFGPRAADRYYCHARDRLGLDFCSPAEPALSAENWRRCQWAARYFNEPHEFVTIPGYLWMGDTPEAKASLCKQVLCLHEDEPAFAAADAESNTTFKLWHCLAGRDVLVIPLRPAATLASADWDQHDPEFEQLVELYCSDGGCEAPTASGRSFATCGAGAVEDATVQAVLARGLRFGFVAGGGSSLTGSQRLGPPAPGVGGLTAVLAEDLTREALWEALLARRTYATTGNRPVIEFAINDEPLGAEVELLGDDLIRLSGRVLGTAPLETVEILKNNRALFRYTPDGPELSFAATDETAVESGDYYYLRVTQTDGHMAWTSPIWIE